LNAPLALHLRLLPGRFAICRLPADAPLPVWAFHAGATHYSITRTPHELSVVCDEDDVPPSVDRAERGWRAFELRGPIPFETTGVIAGLTAPLAAAGVPVFVLSTHDTDYVLVKELVLERAVSALEAVATVER
jgi:hypothetical protein